ncbi:MAG TPA: hypothetical protein VH740_18630 [Vicinamibacterales bacterium]|jgi:hypothetical protein
MDLHAASAPVFQWLRGLAARWAADRRPPFERPLDDPLAGVRAPKPHAPSGRTSSVAVEEPESYERTHAASRTRS